MLRYVLVIVQDETIQILYTPAKTFLKLKLHVQPYQQPQAIELKSTISDIVIRADLTDLLLSFRPFYILMIRIYNEFSREFLDSHQGRGMETEEIKTMGTVLGKKQRNSLGYKIRQTLRYV